MDADPRITGPVSCADLTPSSVSSTPAARPLVPRVSARARLVVVVVLAFGIASVEGLTVMPLIAAIAAGGLLASGQLRHIMARMRGAFALALAFLMVLPLVAGHTPLAQLGPLTLYLEGAQAGALIGGRLLAIVALTLGLLSTLPVFQLVAGLRGLGLPPLMADLALLTLRYLDEVSAQLARARLARRLRGGVRGWRALPDHALLLATGLIRAQARSEALWAAMRLRGYGAGLAARATPLGPRDWAAMLGAGAVAVALVALDRSL
ncbi:energy-coupling factor transporter transmembrane component T family protein [Roseicitreum antarcticum]|nr:energy-coupling factor transporter transmembrane component T [Roseicitreum antarcticum]